MNDTLHWFKSSYSDSGGGDCVEVALDRRPEGAALYLRDSKVPDGPTFAVEPAAWAAFLTWQD
ncbi:DUF397 domain-containing protein [Streptomyces sp. TLI_105]|uniref:DUF397 domain-containing protein n=1 Tax=Streptomyces sp. TLI_105 TaxID=1881019 RepID=UPI00089CAC0B|nr:DUF397 domain-containing protein [Streptomyces sp. TLI_105]SED06842.1 protein of unknown function [Streptomyces sp. TLI_105]